MNNKKSLGIAAMIGVALISIIIFILINIDIDEKRRNSFVLAGDKNSCAYQVEKIDIEDEDLVITGWFFNLRKVSDVSQEINEVDDLGILLYDINNKETEIIYDYVDIANGLECSVKRFERLDVNEFFKCEYDYTNCGFLARIKKENIDLKNGQYQIIFKGNKNNYDNDIQSNSYIDKGKLIYISPKEYYPINVKETDLEEIVEKGVCLASILEYHMVVYQYGKKIYWIADKDYCFEEDGNTYLIYRSYTTQFNKLPASRIENGYYDSNDDANFEDFEITNLKNCGEYRVCERDIPNDFAVYYIQIGQYRDDWVWKRAIRPVINLDKS